MAKYAQIVGNKVHGIFDYDPLPEFAANIHMEPIGGLNPQPQAGWIYTGTTFIEPPAPPAPDYGKHVTRLAMKLRFTATERKTIRAAAETNADVFDFLDLLSDSLYIDLERPETVAGTNQLEAAGLIATGRADEILNTPVQAHEVPL